MLLPGRNGLLCPRNQPTTSNMSGLLPTESKFTARKPYPNPQHADGAATLPSIQAQRAIAFRHPGYPDNNNFLLKIPALDGGPTGGLHHATARIACAVLANCAWNGFLSETRDGPPIAQGEDSLLTGDSYYFRITGSKHRPCVLLHHQLTGNIQMTGIPSFPPSRISPFRITICHRTGCAGLLPSLWPPSPSRGPHL